MHRFGRVHQVGLNGSRDRRYLFRYVRRGRHHRAVGDAVLIQVGDDLARPVDGNMVVLVEVDQLRLQRRAVLHRLGDVGGKGAGVQGATLGAALDLSLMLGDFHPHRWNVEDLPALVALTGHCAQRPLALGADRHTVLLHMLGLRHGLQGPARMTSLAARLLAARRTQAARLRFLETVTEGGLLLLPLCLANWSSKTCTRASRARTTSASSATTPTMASSPWRYNSRTSSEVGRCTDVMMATITELC
jgi:hypothetical protein